jgi:P27 family predicted phage terminase small subunit
LKLLTGNPGRRPLNPAEPKPDSGIPDMPDGLSEAAQAEWNHIAPILLKLGVLTVADGATLAAYCQSRADWLAAQAEIEQYGVTVEEPITNRAGEIVGHRRKKNPAVTVASDAKKLMRAFASDLGLSPAARTRVHAAPGAESQDDEDDVDALRSKTDPQAEPPEA